MRHSCTGLLVILFLAFAACSPKTSGPVVETIGDLVTKTEAELLKLKNFGKTSLKEVKKKLAEHLG